MLTTSLLSDDDTTPLPGSYCSRITFVVRQLCVEGSVEILFFRQIFYLKQLVDGCCESNRRYSLFEHTIY